MATAMKAAFELTLEDKLSAGLNAIKKGFDDLRKVGQEMTLGKLEDGAELVRPMGREVQDLAAGLRRVESAADNAGTAIKRMASTRMQSLKGVGERLFGKSVSHPGEEVKNRGQIGAIGGVISGYSVIQPVQQYAGYENTLRHIAITEKLSGPAVEIEVARLDKNLKADALATGQNSAELAKAYMFLITTGMKSGLVDQLMPQHAKAATAYNISSDSMGQAVFALNDSFKIPHQEIGAALSAMAYAAKEAHFTVENFSHFLPMIGGRMQMLGMTGRPAADTAFAALETVVKNSSEPGVAATDFQQLMTYMTSHRAALEFKKRVGIDLPGSLIAAEKKGINPFDEFMHILQGLVKGKTPVEAGLTLGKIMTNGEAALAALSILQHAPEFMRIRTELAGKDASTLNTDFDTAFRAPEVKLRVGTESAEQLDRRAGKGFEPIVEELIGGLKLIATGIDVADANFPKLTDATLAVTGGLLGLAATLGAIGFVSPAIVAGYGLAKSAAVGASSFVLDAMPVVLPALATYSMLKIGSDAETPQNRAALDQLAQERRSPDGGPNGPTHDGFGPDGRPIPLVATLPATGPGIAKVELTHALPDIRPVVAPGIAKVELDHMAPETRAMMDQLARERRDQDGGPNGPTHDGYGPDGRPIIDTPTPPPAQASEPHELVLRLHADPGTNVEVMHATPGFAFTIPNPGQTTLRP